MTVESVGIAYGDRGDARVTREQSAASIAHCGASRQFLDAYDHRLKRRNGLQSVLAAVKHSLDAIQTYAYAHHVKLILRKTHYAAGVEDVAQQLVPEVGLQRLNASGEVVDLLHGVVVLRGLVGNAQVREHRCRAQHFLLLEQVDERRQLLQGESQAVHASVYLDVHGMVLHAATLT